MIKYIPVGSGVRSPNNRVADNISFFYNIYIYSHARASNVSRRTIIDVKCRRTRSLRPGKHLSSVCIEQTNGFVIRVRLNSMRAMKVRRPRPSGDSRKVSGVLSAPRKTRLPPRPYTCTDRLASEYVFCFNRRTTTE